MNDNKTRDHLGNEYESMSAMCRHYGLPISTVYNRLKRNWTIEQALTIRNDSLAPKVQPRSRKTWHDHLGNEYPTLKKMCDAYGISEKVYQGRVRGCGWNIERALTTPLYTTAGNAKAIEDHLGNKFESVSAMCRYHEIPLSQFKERVRNLKWSVEKALTTPKKDMPKIRPVKCKDHLGNEYPSLSAMCRYYNITRYTFQGRIEKGWDLEKALLSDATPCNKKPMADMAGREFPTAKDMANFYNVPVHRFQNQNTKGKNIADVIEKSLEYYYNGMAIADDISVVKCVSYPYFLVRTDDDEKTDTVMHVENILSIYHNSSKFEPLTKAKIPHAVKIKKKLGFPWYEAEYEERTCIMSYWQIIELDAKANFGLNLRHEANSNTGHSAGGA